MNRLHTRAAAYFAAIFAGYMAVLMLIPASVDLYYGNPDWKVFVISAILVGGLSSSVALATHGERPPISARFGFLLVNILWVTTAFAGAVPFLEASVALDATDAVFEAVSGLTTTGSTVLTGLDNMPPGILLWRSFLQWVGGIGVIAFGLFALPFLRVGGVSQLKIESSDIDDLPFSRYRSYIIALVSIYVGLTAVCVVAYVAGGMTPFNAINNAMATLSTGGFSTSDKSFGLYTGNPAILWTAVFFMFIAALPFSILILLVTRRRLDTLLDPQIRVYAAYTVVFVLLVALYLRIADGVSFGLALTLSAFNIVSVITTTGFASGDYTEWGPFAVACFFVATFLGGCSGSTSGGIKAYRFYVLYQMLTGSLRGLIYPHSVNQVRYGDRQFDTEMQRAVALFVAAFGAILCALTLLLAATGLDILTALTGVITALTNVGPGLGTVIGPAGNFVTLTDFAKWVLIAAMLLGRLEILAVLVLLSPAFWTR